MLGLASESSETLGEKVNAFHVSLFVCVCGGGESISESPSRHMGPVWQLRWCPQNSDLSPKKDCSDSVFSVAADGRTSRWNQSSSGLECLGITTNLITHLNFLL